MDVDAVDKNTGGETTTAKVDDKTFMGLNIRMLREKIEKATMGYMRIDLINPPPGSYWGQFNNREIMENQVKPLLKDFVENWVDNCCDAHAIEVAVKPGWLVLNPRDPKVPIKVNGMDIMNVPALEFTREGADAIIENNLWMLGGNHRREALRRFLDDIAKKISELKAGIAKLQEDQHKAGLPGASEYSGYTIEKDKEGDRLQREIEELEEKIATDRMWVVRLIDRGAPRDILR
jgi:hypothetical protein